MALVCRNGVLECALTGAVNLTLEEVKRALYGPALARGKAIARLTEHQCLTLFPGAKRVHARNLRRIGQRLTCKLHKEPAGDCPTCKVEGDLRGLGFDALVKAARYTTPEEQLRAAAAHDMGSQGRTRSELHAEQTTHAEA